MFSNAGALKPVVNGLTGQPVPVGTTFRVALYFAADGVTDEIQFVQLGNPLEGLRPWLGTSVSAVGTAPCTTSVRGGFGMFQVRAWESAFGSTYEQAVSNSDPQGGRLALAAKSGIMRVDTADPLSGEPQASLIGIGSVAVIGPHLRDGFTLTVVPEPAPLLFFLAGAAGVLIIRRFR